MCVSTDNRRELFFTVAIVTGLAVTSLSVGLLLLLLVEWLMYCKAIDIVVSVLPPPPPPLLTESGAWKLVGMRDSKISKGYFFVRYTK
jgi:hypothetical protein